MKARIRGVQNKYEASCTDNWLRPAQKLEAEVEAPLALSDSCEMPVRWNKLKCLSCLLNKAKSANLNHCKVKGQLLLSTPPAFLSVWSNSLVLNISKAETRNSAWVEPNRSERPPLCLLVHVDCWLSCPIKGLLKWELLSGGVIKEVEMQRGKWLLVNNPSKLRGFDNGYDSFAPLFLLHFPSRDWTTAGRVCYCSSGRSSYFLCSGSARRWLHPCILVQLLTSAAFTLVRLSQARTHTHSQSHAGKFKIFANVWTDTHVSAQREMCSEACLAATADWACREIFREHGGPICGCSSVMRGSWMNVCVFVTTSKGTGGRGNWPVCLFGLTY